MRQIFLIVVSLLLSASSAAALFTDSVILSKGSLITSALLMGVVGMGGLLHWFSQDQVDVRDIWRTKLEIAKERIQVLEEDLQKANKKAA